MSSQRIKGQEVSVIIVRDGNLEDTLTNVQSLNVELQFEIKSQGYLGETTNRKDEIFNGLKFDMELHLHTQDFLTFIAAILARAKRVTPDMVINISGVFAFPNGQTPVLTLPDVKFGSMPLNISSRGDYVKVKVEGEGEDFDVQKAA